MSIWPETMALLVIWGFIGGLWFGLRCYAGLYKAIREWLRGL